MSRKYRLVLSFALSLSALPAAAQTGACDQPSALTDRLEAPLAEGFAEQRLPAVLRRSEPRYIEFTLDGAQDITLRTEGPGTDPILALYDSSGAMRDWDDDGGGGLESRIARTLPGGVYCAQIRVFGSAPVDRAEVDLLLESGITAPPADPDAPCEDPGLTGDLASGLAGGGAPLTLTGHLGEDQGRSWYRLSLDEALRLRLDAMSSDFDTILTIYDADGRELHENDDFIGTDSRIDEAFDAGAYCVGLRGFGGGGGDFTLALETFDAGSLPVSSDPCGDPALTRELAHFPQPGDRVSVYGQGLNERTGQSWFAFALDQRRELRLDAGSDSFDTVLELYDGDGGYLMENDDSPEGGTTDSRIDAVLDPGDYCLVLRGFAGGTGDFTVALAVPEAEDGPAGNLPDPATAEGVEDLGVLETGAQTQTISSGRTLWAFFTLPDAGVVDMEGVSVTSAFTLAIFDAEGAMIDASAPTPAFDAARLSPELAAGGYLVALTNSDGSDDIKLRQITLTRR